MNEVRLSKEVLFCTRKAEAKVVIIGGHFVGSLYLEDWNDREACRTSEHVVADSNTISLSK